MIESKSTEIFYSLVVCTYQPEIRILERCLKAIQQLKAVEGKDFELILIDNNSADPVAQNASVSSILLQVQNARSFTEVRQGLTFARLRGATEAKGSIIVFVDDDNEIEPDYLAELGKLTNSIPSVAVWGPGKIKVDFIDGVNENAENYLRPMFQEKDFEFKEYSSQRRWQKCYPVGTGIVVRRNLLLSYLNMVEKERLTLTDRKGSSLSSGGDVQLVLFCIAQGYAAGTSPTLKVKHLIPKKKLQFSYLKELAFGTSVCFHQCHLEVFPEYWQELTEERITANRNLRRIFRRFIKLQFNPAPLKTIRLIEQVGSCSGVYLALNQQPPSLLNWLKKKLLS